MSLCLRLRAVLTALSPADATGWVAAVSGGIDSLGLLAALAELRADSGAWARAARRPPPPLRALHIDHGLQPAAAAFREACAAACTKLRVPLHVVKVAVRSLPGLSLEAQAREARYLAFAAALEPGECLLTAHHELDQAETVLLQLLRGAGVRGLSAMPPRRAFGMGWHLRPLLGIAKRELDRYAAAAGVRFVADPMNADRRFDRAYLRERVWPLLEQRWPGAAPALARAASHIADAHVLLDRSAKGLVGRLRDGEALSITGLRALPALEQVNAVRCWIAEGGAAPPSRARLCEALRQMADAGTDHQPVIAWATHALRRYRDRLYLTAAAVPTLADPCAWPRQTATLDLGPGLGRLRWSMQAGGLDAARMPMMLSVRRRQGGESLKPGLRARTQSVQHLCQRLGVLPWMRDALPLVYAGDSLIAVGDLWHDARWCVAAHEQGLVCTWEHAPIVV